MALDAEALRRYAGAGEASDSAWLNIGYRPRRRLRGICGTLAAAAMLAWYDDHRDDALIPERLRPRFDPSPGGLIDALMPLIERWHPGTLPFYLSRGLNRYLRQQDLAARWRARWGLATRRHVARSLARGEPLCVGLVKPFGSPYGFHFVLVYGRVTAENGHERWLCVDNWGAVDAELDPAWTCGCCWLEPRN